VEAHDPDGSTDPLAGLGNTIAVLAGRSPSKEELQRFRQYLDLLVLWNRTHGLTGRRSRSAIARDLFEDSLLFLALLPPGPLTVADIGTGAGIPGVPLRIVRPDISLTLIESRRKRVSFLATLKRELKLSDVVILEGRAEDLIGRTPDMAGKFHVVVSRSVGVHLLPTALKYLEPGGLFVASGPPPRESRTAVASRAQLQWEEIAFPDLGMTRTFLLGRKPA